MKITISQLKRIIKEEVIKLSEGKKDKPLISTKTGEPLKCRDCKKVLDGWDKQEWDRDPPTRREQPNYCLRCVAYHRFV